MTSSQLARASMDSRGFGITPGTNYGSASFRLSMLEMIFFFLKKKGVRVPCVVDVVNVEEHGC